MIPRSILVCDPDRAFLANLRQASETMPVGFLTAATATEAQHLVANRANRLAAVCLHSAIAEGGPVPLIRFCRSHRPATPISLVTDDPQFPSPEFDLEALQVQRVLRKPLDPAALVAKLIPSTVFELDKAMELSSQDRTEAGGMAEHDDGDMHPIEADSFLCGSVSYFDVYVKLGGKKYVKILKAKDNFDAERVGSYLKKGVRYFYIKKDAQVYFLQYCDKLTEAILAKPEFSTAVKQRQVSNLGRETGVLLRSIGLSESTVTSAAKFIDYTHKLTKQLNLRQQPQLAQFVDQLRESDHCAGTSMVVSALLDGLGFRDEDVISVIGLGAFLHDVGLFLLPNGLGDRDYDDLDEKDRAEFEKHPILGADAVDKITQLSPLVPQIVRQHHERRNRKGYPAKLGPGAIAPMAEIIGIADTFQELIAKSFKDPTVNPLLLMEQLHFDNFSFQTVEGFRKAFLVKK